ncbi:MAG: peptidoglycan bridge formation glycyltransferase FemA/FemB family protein [Candidatus Staskawiczbacteria bacterium]|nr:peptidoglycan bridge formation glycyltransferase FemA/FemB family protein [Candidatus Staskawiczbacteria bacterium]
MEIKEINPSFDGKNQWEEFLLLCDRKSFLHSWNWGEFQKSLGNKIWRLGIYEDGQLLAVALTIKHTARRGSYLIVPHGPVVSLKLKTQNSKLKVLEVLLTKLKELAREEKVDFIRISPIWERTEENIKLFNSLGFSLRPLHSHPESSWKLNIEASEEDLMNGMRKTTRYLIKQAEKNKDIHITRSFDIKDVEEFNKMHLEVVKKQNFVPFSLEYFRKEFMAFEPDKQIALFIANYKGKVIAASYGIFWNNMAFYHHAALLPEYKKIPASYLLQWEAIKEAKRKGCKIYDFWGYSDPVKNPNHPYSGPTLFKMGFGGYKDEYVLTQDLPTSHKYWISYIIESIRRVKRGL